jgi:hypothetical protein
MNLLLLGWRRWRGSALRIPRANRVRHFRAPIRAERNPFVMFAIILREGYSSVKMRGVTQAVHCAERDNASKAGGATPKSTVAQVTGAPCRMPRAHVTMDAGLIASTDILNGRQVGGQGGNQRPLGRAKGAVIKSERSSSRSTDHRGRDETAGKEPPAAIYQPLESKVSRLRNLSRLQVTITAYILLSHCLVYPLCFSTRGSRPFPLISWRIC